MTLTTSCKTLQWILIPARARAPVRAQANPRWKGLGAHKGERVRCYTSGRTRKQALASNPFPLPAGSSGSDDYDHTTYLQALASNPFPLPAGSSGYDDYDHTTCLSTMIIIIHK